MSDAETPRREGEHHHEHGEHHHHHGEHRSHHHHGGAASNSSMDRDNKRTQFQRAALIMPAVLFAIGLLVWGWGMNYNDLDMPNDRLVTCGGWMMGICGGIFALLLLADWTNRAKKAIRDARERRERRESEREQHRSRHRHHHHHHHHEDAPSGEGTSPFDDHSASRSRHRRILFIL